MKAAVDVRGWHTVGSGEDDLFEGYRASPRRLHGSNTRSAKNDALEWWSSSIEEPVRRSARKSSRPIRPSGAAQRFSERRDRWIWSNVTASNPSLRLQDPDFLAIVAMGRAAVPFVLAEVASSRNPLWIYVLPAMAGEDPSKDAGSLDEAIQQWLQWGKSRGLI